MRIQLLAVGLMTAGLLGGATVAWGQGNRGAMGGSTMSYSSPGGMSSGIGAMGGGGIGGGSMGAGGLGGGGSSGMFGARSMGSSLGMGQSAFGGGSFGSGMSGMGMGGLGSGSMGSMGMTNRPGYFIGASSQNMPGFIGAAQSTTAGRGGNAMMSRGGMTGMAGMGGMGGSGYAGYGRSAMGMMGGQFGQTGGNSAPVVRSTYHIAFDYTTTAPTRLNAAVTQRLADTSAIHARSPIQVVMQGQTAVLHGVVATEHDRALAGQLVRLEAGVVGVDNEIVVGNADQPNAAAPKN